MFSVLQKPKLLIVDTDTTMAQVLKTYAELNNYESDVFSDPADACAALAGRSARTTITSGYDCMILGWPKGEIRIISDVLIALSGATLSELPLIVLSEEPDQEPQSLARRRARTRNLLWRDYTRIENVLDSIVIRDSSGNLVSSVKQNPDNASAPGKGSNRLPTSILLVDDSPTVCHVLRDMLENKGYFVALASTVAEARSAIAQNNFDLVLTEFFLPEESGEDLCHYLQSMSPDKRPVYAVMARKNLESTVVRSLSVGAIACLDKSESTEVLYARLNAIATGLSSRNAAVQKPVDTASVARLLQIVKAPSLLIDEHRNILAANDTAAQLLSAGNVSALEHKSFEKLIHAAPIRRTIDTPVRALFKSLTGQSISVAYRCRDIDVSEYGITDNVSMMTFQSVEESSTVNKEADQISVSEIAGVNRVTITESNAHYFVNQPAAESVGSELVDQEIANQEIASREIVSHEINSANEIPSLKKSYTKPVHSLIEYALNDTDKNATYSLLTLDVKMVASVTGDRLSIGHSRPMLEIVEAALNKYCAPHNKPAYIGGGRFIVLFRSGRAEQSRASAEKLVCQLPEFDTRLTDVQLLSHASIVELPRQSDLTVDYILKHCAAACLKTELDGLDNSIYTIDLPANMTNGKMAREEMTSEKSVLEQSGIGSRATSHFSDLTKSPSVH